MWFIVKGIRVALIHVETIEPVIASQWRIRLVSGYTLDASNEDPGLRAMLAAVDAQRPAATAESARRILNGPTADGGGYGSLIGLADPAFGIETDEEWEQAINPGVCRIDALRATEAPPDRVARRVTLAEAQLARWSADGASARAIPTTEPDRDGMPIAEAAGRTA